MRAPRKFKWYKKRAYSLCLACQEWKMSNNIFFHEGILWNLCINDYFDYWENTDKLLSDFKDHDYKEWG